MALGRTLVLSVDRDDDIGYKAGIVSPVIGREECLNAAVNLALADPEDSDVNAIFQAVKTYDELKAAGEDVEVALISGNHLHMIEGDRRIAEHLEMVVSQTGVTSCIMIADGAEDEFVIPIIQSKLPVASIRRVVVSQIANLEGTYYTIKKLLNDPKFSRIFLVPLGLAMLLYVGAYRLGHPEYATTIIVGGIGMYLLYRGLGIDDLFRGFMKALRTTLKRNRFSFATYIVGILLFVVGIVQGLWSIQQQYPPDKLYGILEYWVTFIYGSVPWFTFGGVVSSIGIIIDNYFYEREGLAKVIVFPFFISAIGLIAYGAITYVMSFSIVADPPSIDTALLYIYCGIIDGFACIFAGVIIKRFSHRRIVGHQLDEESAE